MKHWKNRVIRLHSCFRTFILPVFTRNQLYYIGIVAISGITIIAIFQSFLSLSLVLCFFFATLGVLSTTSPCILIIDINQIPVIRASLAQSGWSVAGDAGDESIFTKIHRTWANSWENDTIELAICDSIGIIAGPYMTLISLADKLR